MAEADPARTTRITESTPSPRLDFGPLNEPGDRIGPYQILSVLGEGGFGVVYLAERREPIVQRVALKVIKPGMDTRAVVARFEQERQALAVMDHPNIARVYDAGATPTGRPYFVMEHVRGEPITQYCDRLKLSIRDRLALFLIVCEAVQHAHTKGVIHRDLKPSNILVSERAEGAGAGERAGTRGGSASGGGAGEVGGGAPGIPKIIDFGVAKAVSHTLTDKTIFTEQGQIIGTPEYMSPEQAEMGKVDIDTRTDVYSLGVLLYELLTGLLPFDSRDLRSKGYAGIQRVIREVDPPRPSTRLSSLKDSIDQVAASRRLEPRRLASMVRGDLEWIVMKCLEKDRARRYEAVVGLAADLRRHLTGEPVFAAPPSAAYRASKFVRRHKVGVAAGLAVGVALVAGVAGTSIGLVHARRAEGAANKSAEEARTRLAQATAVQGFLRDLLKSADPELSKGKEVTVKEILDEGARKVGESFKDQPEVEATLRETLGETYNQLARYKEAKEQFLRALELREKVLGPDNVETMTTRHNLGAILLSQREPEEATVVLERALSDRRRVLGDAAEDTLVSESMLGFAKQLSGDREGALKLYRETLERQRKHLGENAKPTLETMSSIADVLQDLGQLEEAEKVARDLVSRTQMHLGPDAQITMSAESILASILKDLARYDEAEAMARQVLAAKTRVFGEQHSETAITMNVLALILEQQKKYDEQAAVLRKAIAWADKELGPDNNVTLTYVANLGRCEQLRGDLAQAEVLMRRVLTVRKKELGNEAVDTLVVMNNLGLLLLDEKKPADAEAILREMVAGLAKGLPADHWMQGQARINLAESLIDQQKFDDAEKEILAGYDKLRTVLPEGHDRVKKAANSVADLYKKWGKPEQEAAWREKAADPKPPEPKK